MLSRIFRLLVVTTILLTTGSLTGTVLPAFCQQMHKQLTVKDFTQLSEKESVPRFNLRKLLDSYGTKKPSEYGPGIVRIYDGDLRVDGPLWMDFEKGPWAKSSHQGMIVTGNLEVSGNIL